MTLWVVRAGKHGEWENDAITQNMVVVGWAELQDLSDIQSREELSLLIEAAYPDKGSNAVKNWESQLWAFTKRFEIDDLVALPLKNQGAMAFGRITGPYQFDAKAPEGVKHRRSVEWLATDIPRSRIDIDLRNSLDSGMTVFEVKRNNAEVRIKAILAGEEPTLPPPLPDTESDADENDTKGLIDPATQATDQIIDFIGRHFKGHGLAHLVAGILGAQGYTAHVSPPGPDGGVDIVAGRGPMGFDPPRLCVQVKSGDTPVDVKVLRELQGVMKNYRAEQGLVVSWGGFRRSVIQEARQLYFEVRLWNQTDLVQALQEAYEHLDDQLQAELPLKRIWVLVPEEED